MPENYLIGQLTDLSFNLNWVLYYKETQWKIEVPQDNHKARLYHIVLVEKYTS